MLFETFGVKYHYSIYSRHWYVFVFLLFQFSLGEGKLLWERGLAAQWTAFPGPETVLRKLNCKLLYVKDHEFVSAFWPRFDMKVRQRRPRRIRCNISWHIYLHLSLKKQQATVGRKTNITAHTLHKKKVKDILEFSRSFVLFCELVLNLVFKSKYWQICWTFLCTCSVYEHSKACNQITVWARFTPADI